MNFFEAQERARKVSRNLVLWFGLCVLAVVCLVYLVLAYALKAAGLGQPNDQGLQAATGWWQPELFLGTLVVVGGLIVIGSLCKLARLSGGGSVIASDLGGRQVDPSTRDPMERRLLNVVEEMSIASGTPMPEVWVMDHEGAINAFAAGTDPGNTVIGVTRGTLEQLTRSELQGVIAHEYSHIVNGDMKLNMRLTGWIFGLVMIALVGRVLMQSFRFIRSSRDNKAGGVVLALVLLGVAVWIIGSIGVLFARMIQAAISRQREFLADAAAVQFTRYPEGIAGALKKIGGFTNHGEINSANAAEARHMFFASSNLSSVLATHPPLEERILAIQPNWKGEMLEGGTDPVSQNEFKGAQQAAGPARATSSSSGAATPPPIPGTEALQDAMGTAGAIPGMNAGMIAALAVAEEQAQTTGLIHAQAAIYGLLIPKDDQQPGREILTEQGCDETLISAAMQTSSNLNQAPSHHKLTCIDTSLPWLRRMTPDQGRAMIETIQRLIEADGQIDLFEFMLKQVSQRHIEIGLGLRKPPGIRHKRIHELESELADLLAIFAAIAEDDNALQHAIEEYREHTGRELPMVEMNFQKAAEGLQRMDASTPIVKKQILRLCLLSAKQDGQINDNEAELLRAVAEAIGCSLPRGRDAFADLN